MSRDQAKYCPYCGGATSVGFVAQKSKYQKHANHFPVAVCTTCDVRVQVMRAPRGKVHDTKDGAMRESRKYVTRYYEWKAGGFQGSPRPVRRGDP